MLRGIRKVVGWWRAPEREVLRREMQWTTRAMRRPGRLLLLAFFASFAFAQGYFLFVSEALGRRTRHSDAQEIFLITMFCWPVVAAIFFASWVWLLDRRALAPFARERLRDLVMTPLRASELWPAFLLAPALWSVFFVAALGIGYTAAFVAVAIAAPALEVRGPDPALFLFVAAMLCGLAVWLGFGSLAVAAFTARRSLPDAGWAATVGWAAVGFACVFALPFVMAALVFAAAWVLAAMVFCGLVIGSLGLVGGLFAMLGEGSRQLRRGARWLLAAAFTGIARVARFFARNVFGWGMFRRNLKRLRSREVWEALVSLAGRG